MGNFQRAMECFNEWDAKKSEELARNEDVLDYLEPRNHRFAGGSEGA